MTKGLKRYSGQGELHFVTFSCYRRLPLLRAARSKNLLVEILAEVRDRYGFSLVGYVVMPEHVHLLISEPKTGTPSTVSQVLKQRFSRRLRREPRRQRPSAERKLFSESSDDLPVHYWERRFHDFNVWSRKKRVEKLLYMHLNPVKRGLVAHPRDWPWSSFGFYQAGSAGLIRIDPIS